MKIRPNEKIKSFDELLRYINPGKYIKDPVHITDPFRGKFSEIEFIGPVKPKPEPRVINPNEATIKDHYECDLMFMNINSIQSVDKRELAEEGVRRANPHIVIFAETKLGEDDYKFNLDQYHTVTEVTRKAGAGGMMVMAKNTIDITNFHATSVVKEVQVVNFTFNDHLIIGVYRSPSVKGPEINQHRKLIQHLSKLIDKNPPESPFTIVGDFNLPELAACDFHPVAKLFDYTAAFDDNKETKNQLWAEFFRKYNLKQHIKEGSRSTSNNVLDLLITTKTQDAPYHRVSQTTFHNSLDHYPILFKIETEFKTEEVMRTRRKTDPRNLENMLARVWARDLEEYCPTDKAENVSEYLTNELWYAFDTECPLIKVKAPPINGHKSRELVRTMRQSNRVKWELKNKDLNEEQYETIKARLKLLNKYVKFMCKRDRVRNDIRKFEVSAKKKKNFYAHVKKVKSKQTSKIGPVLDSNGILRTTKEEMAVAFGEYHEKQLRPEKSLKEMKYLSSTWPAFENLPFNQLEGEKPYPDWMEIDWFSTNKNAPEQTLTHAQMSPKFIIEQIRKAKRSSAPGPDELPMLVYSVTAKAIAPILYILFKLINDTGEIPTAFKRTKVQVLFKKKDKKDMSNYRPLSMSNQIGKIWERCLNSLILDHLESQNLLHQKQEGFRRKRGTFSNLHKLWEDVTGKVERWKALVEMWNYDLTKAFDRLDHSIVLDLCHQAGIGGYFGLSLQNWLVERTQYVEIDVYKSKEIEVSKSCIQGSVLGPTLWTIYINTLLVRLENANQESNLGISFFAYADDLTIVKHIETQQEANEMHDVLAILEKWAIDYKMTWSAAKTQRLVFKHRGCREPREPRFIIFNGKPIMPLETRTMKTKCESLGVIFSRDMMFTDQRNRIVTDVKSLTILMAKFFHNKTQELLVRFFWTYMVPKITYCSTIWNPGSEKYLREIDKAVETYWKMNKQQGTHGGAPPGILKPSLHYILIDVIFIHKMMTGNTSLEFDEFFKFCETTTRQGSQSKLKLPKYSLLFSRHKLSFRGVIFFNTLPPEYKELPLTLFKKAAKAHIIENTQMYENLTRDIAITGKLPGDKEPDPTPTNTNYLVINEKIKAIKRLHHQGLKSPHAWGIELPKTNANGITKFWVPGKDFYGDLNSNVKITMGLNQDQTYEHSRGMYNGPNQKYLRVLPEFEEEEQPEKIKIPRALKRLM